MTLDSETGQKVLDAVEVERLSHKEAEIAQLLGPSDELEFAWLEFCRAVNLAAVKYLQVAYGPEWRRERKDPS